MEGVSSSRIRFVLDQVQGPRHAGARPTQTAVWELFLDKCVGHVQLLHSLLAWVMGQVSSSWQWRSLVRVILGSSSLLANEKLMKSSAHICCMPVNFVWMHAYLTHISSLLSLLEMWNLNGSCEGFANWTPLISFHAPPLAAGSVLWLQQR
jgi:hypothetical protein